MLTLIAYCEKSMSEGLRLNINARVENCLTELIEGFERKPYKGPC